MSIELQATAPVFIRDARDEDFAAIHAIYVPYVLHGFATFEEQDPGVQALRNRWQDIVAAGLPYLVATRNNQVVGYTYATSYRARPAYRHTLENSVYVAPGLSKQGVGSALMTALIARCEQGPWRQLIAVIGDSANTGSIALHAKHGFRHTGVLHAVGFKLGRWVDTVLMQRAIGLGDQDCP